MSEFGLFLLVAPIVFSIRALFVLPAGRFTIPPAGRAALEHARPAVLAALLATVIAGSGPLATPDVHAIAIAGGAAVVSRRWSMPATVLAGVAIIVAMGLAGW